MAWWNSTPAPAAPTTIIHSENGPIITIPETAIERLKEMRGEGKRRKLWSSDLSPDELLAIRSMRFRPAGMVMGSSVYHIGLTIPRYRVSEELPVLTQALYNARENAMIRMMLEAEALGADGIVGVRLKIEPMSYGDDEIEYVAIGTAIYREDGDGEKWRTHDGKPFTSLLSGQGFFKNYKAGYRPLGLVLGNCVYHVAHLTMRQAWSTAWRNCERTNFTDALYAARELAQERMDLECEKLHAEGVDGVRIEQNTHWAGNGHVIEFFTIGTAITPIEGKEDTPVEEPHLVMTLDA
jgi:uncharacterized protein YbjQ (UPF0145 family)